jgi:hypothetical protein
MTDARSRAIGHCIHQGVAQNKEGLVCVDVGYSGIGPWMYWVILDDSWLRTDPYYYNSCSHAIRLCIQGVAENKEGLVCVNLSSSGIGHKDSPNTRIPRWQCRLSRALAGNTTVKTLCLDGCNLDDAGVAELVNALKINKTLEEISLRKVGIKQDKALAMVKALLSNNVLKKLDLSANDLGEVAVAALANGLIVNDTLVSIALSGSTKGNDCALRLAAALRINHKVSHLDLSYCGVERTGILALALAIQATAAQRAEIFHLGRITTGAQPTYSDGSESIRLRSVAVKLGFPVQSRRWSNRRITTQMLAFGKMFAFAMGTHTRLGGDNQSLVFTLNKDVCVMILKAWEWPPTWVSVRRGSGLPPGSRLVRFR